MRINQFIAQATGLSRRGADAAIAGKQVLINGLVATLGQQVTDADQVSVNGVDVQLSANQTTLMLNKPPGYVVSRDGQGSRTIYDLLPIELDTLKAIGRLDKNTSGLLLLTSDGQLANKLSHPRYAKTKIYEAMLDKPLLSEHKTAIETGVKLNDGVSRLALKGRDRTWQITMHEGRNRQIRRTFEAEGYQVISLRRTSFGPYTLGSLGSGNWQYIQEADII
jgi:23S rRNA pseudouridine2605 synthase